jgi:UDP-N-acetylglucosamine transferase subunit ALG13
MTSVGSRGSSETRGLGEQAEPAAASLRPGPPALCLAASPGGHLTLLQALSGAFSDVRRVWITGVSSQANALRASGEEVHILAAWARDSRGLRGTGANFASAARLARLLKPRLVVTSGAGLVVPFALAARARGSQLVVIETMARVTDASLTGRILAPFARKVLVQWPEMRRAHRNASVCRPALLQPPDDGAASAGPLEDGSVEGTFVSVGTRPEPFDRLLATVDDAINTGLLPRPVRAQSGASRYLPENYTTTPWMSPQEIDAAIKDSRHVVCHGGAAIMASTVRSGRKPIVMPRMKARHEHRTQHQQQIVQRLGDEGLVVPVWDRLEAAHVEAALERPRLTPGRWSQPSLEAAVRGELESVLAGG